MQFLNSSLDKLTKTLPDEDFKYLAEDFGSKNLELLKQKSAYPYEYMNIFKRFKEKNCLLENIFIALQKIYGKISDGHISAKDYLTYKKICHKFEMKNMGDYHDHYLKKDVFLLADVYEKVIDTCVKYYGLHPCHYFSSPGLNWDTMLKMTDIKLEKNI